MTNGLSERALKLAIVTGLRAALGPALVARAQGRPESQNLELAALGEMAVDKLGMMPDQDRLLPLLARGAAGYWVTRQCAEEEGSDDPWAAPLGAAIAMGVALVAPKIRKTIGWTTGVPHPILGMVEDYLALRLGAEAVEMPMEELTAVARQAVDSVMGRVRDVAESAGLPRDWSALGSQSAGAGSM